eukprot:gene1125-1430_t
MLLEKYTHLIYIETDTGQSEFTIPGLISVNIIDKPILGPPFTHQRKPLRSYFFGDTSPKNNPQFYLNLVNQIIDGTKLVREKLPNLPVILNTNGWLKGIGLHLIEEIIKYFNPTHIYQLYSEKFFNNNFNNNNQQQQQQIKTLISFSQDQINQLFLNDNNNNNNNNNETPKLINIKSIQTNNLPLYQLSAAEHRMFSTRQYFSMNSTPLQQQIPYQINCKDLKVKILTNQVPPSQIMYSLNASLIGICYDKTEYKSISYKINSKTPQFIQDDIQISECLGLGIIRSIDIENGVFYIVTPIDFEQLQKANVILKGSIDIPPSVTISTSSKGDIFSPYFCLESLSKYGTGSGTMDRPKQFTL